jgi:hypothetical protein
MLLIAPYFVDRTRKSEDYDLVKDRIAQAHADDDAGALELFNNLRQKLEKELQSSE